MERYVAYLLQDIRAAHRAEVVPAPAEELDPDEAFDAQIAEVEQYVSGGEEEPYTLAESLGLDPAAFPPPAQLSEEQMAEIAQALREALFSYNICAELPDGVPGRIAYPLVVGLLGERLRTDRHGLTHWNFCEDNPATCQLGPDFCTCKDEWEEDAATDFEPPFGQPSW